MTDAHHNYMQEALALAEKQLGQTWPNPSVGCVIVKDGNIIAKAATAEGGRPHAEVIALAQAGRAAKGATLYVSLEPCAHTGKTPPCADAVINAGIVHCVVACRDRNPKVDGAGIAKLKAAGIEVTEGICQREAETINRGFFSLIEKNRPFIALKIATSDDGKIAYPEATKEFYDETSRPSEPSARLMRKSGDFRGGNPRWITSEAARNQVHEIRSQYDAILTGIGTVLADDPLLTCRIEGLEHKSPVRVVLDRQGRLPATSQLAKTRKDVPLWVLSQPSIEEVVAHMAAQGITRLLVEAGQQLNTAFLESGLVDRVYWFKAPLTIGEGGLAAFTNYEKAASTLAGWRRVAYSAHPPDTLEILEPCSPAS